MPLDRVLDSVMAGLGGPSVDTMVVLHERWSEVVGPEVADHARPRSIEGGRLRIVVDSPAWASHLRWAEAEILERLRTLAGPDEVTSVAIAVDRR